MAFIHSSGKVTKTYGGGQQVRALDALTKDLGSRPSSQMAVSSMDSSSLLWTPWTTKCTQYMYMLMQANTYPQRRPIFKGQSKNLRTFTQMNLSLFAKFMKNK